MLILFIFFLILSNALGFNRISIILSRNCFVFLFFCLLCGLNTYYITYLQKGLGLFGGLFQTNYLTHFFHLFIISITMLISQLTSYYPRKNIKNEKILNIWLKKIVFVFTDILWNKQFKTNIKNLINKMSEQFTIMEYSLISFFVIAGGTFLISSGDLVSIFLSIELQSYGLYLITVLYRDSEKSTYSGLTYFLLGSLSSCFILLGIAFIYINTGITFLDNYYLITNLTLDKEFLSLWYKTYYIQYSLVLISVGFLFKISAAPFHFWSPDVYDGVPTIVTTFIALIGKLSILILLLQIVHYTKSHYINTDTYTLNSTIILSSLLSLLIGTVLGLTQNRIKRLLAYSTISHLGFILLALTIETAESRQAFIFYITQYTVTNLNAFIIIIAIGYSYYLYINNKPEYKNLSDINNSPLQIISQIKGFYQTNPFLSVCLMITMLSFIGLPPLIGFFAKQMVLSSALDNGFMFLIIIAVITSVIGAVYYLNIIKTTIFDEPEYEYVNKIIYASFSQKKHFEDFSLYTEKINRTLSIYLSLTISQITLFIFIFILAPIESLNLSNILSNITLNKVSLDSYKFTDLFIKNGNISIFNFFLIFIPILSLILLATNFIFSRHNPNKEKNSVFWCGFHSIFTKNLLIKAIFIILCSFFIRYFLNEYFNLDEFFKDTLSLILAYGITTILEEGIKEIISVLSSGSLISKMDIGGLLNPESP